ncbi:MAG: DUF4132 domain-containing protein [Meiothermus sp.]|nr:DUF4132 domain-containing protein [Meiothermus sp.]
MDAREVASHLGKLLEEVNQNPSGLSLDLSFERYPSARFLLDSAPIVRVIAIKQLSPIMLGLGEVMDDSWKVFSTLYDLHNQLSKSLNHLPTEQTAQLLNQLASTAPELLTFGLLESLLNRFDKENLAPSVREDLTRIRQTALNQSDTNEMRLCIRLVDALLANDALSSVFDIDDWGAQMTTDLQNLPPEESEWSLELFALCSNIGSANPSKAWLKKAERLVGTVGEQAFYAHVSRWLGFLQNTSGEPAVYEPAFNYQPRGGAIVGEQNADLLKGLVWSCTVLTRLDASVAVGTAALASFRKIRNIGARSTKVGNACVAALSAMPNLWGVGQLERLRQVLKKPSQRAYVEKAMAQAAVRSGLSKEDLEELGVPKFDLVEGKRRVDFGEFHAWINLSGLGATVSWFDAQDRQRKSVPAEVKRSHKAEYKALLQLTDAIGKALNAQRDRLERLAVSGRCWSYSTFKERYLEHQLMSYLAHRLIWRLGSGEQARAGVWLGGQFVDAQGHPLDSLDSATTVSPWHPVFSPASKVLVWREFLERNEITQPFKQAYREIYLLTDAERHTQTYSNRFAAHVIRQHQFHALAQQRNWRYSLMGRWDSHNTPCLDLPGHGLRVEFWVEPVEADDEVSGSVYNLVTTDQMRFFRVNHNQGTPPAGWARLPDPIPLEQIPPLVFSEVMRDVDLFVGVCSVGNDPTWQDGGPQGRYRDYWQSYSFGELSASAQTRKELLSRLLPRLKIAGQCELEGCFLKVRGSLRTYKIHLGSGNILMEPNDQYLCIVPSQSSEVSSPVFLPFEGDRTLSVILSKAFLLAADGKITDPTITRQIK